MYRRGRAARAPEQPTGSRSTTKRPRSSGGAGLAGASRLWGWFALPDAAPGISGRPGLGRPREPVSGDGRDLCDGGP